MSDYPLDFIQNIQEEEPEFLPILPEEEDQPNGLKADVPDVLPLLPLRNTILFPGVVMPITIGRDKSIHAVKEAYKTNKLVGVTGQIDATIEEPDFEHLFKVGTIAQILRMIKMPDGSTTAIIQGRSRIRIIEEVSREPYLRARVTALAESWPENNTEFDAEISTMRDLATQIIKLNPSIPTEATIVIKNISNPANLTHFISSNLNIENSHKQQLLEMEDMAARVKKVLELLNTELQLLEIKSQIHSKVRGDIDKQQREYFLSQQLKTIQDELGLNTSDKDIQRLKDKARLKKWSKEVQETFDKEIERLQRTNPAAAEFSVTLNYLDLLTDLPWNEYTEDKIDIKTVKKTLEKDHFGIEKVKERILEYLAVLKLKGDMKSPILCLVGPPGVGKTSLGQSIARALERKYTRIALGGLHDEAEIRGHRKTYIGAMPGRIIQAIKKAKSSNPVIILDEIDKVGSDFKGDPSSALLEVLDPEQNHAFYDNYLELEFDLSRVMFIATANSLSSIQPALRDRMEIIHIEGYSQEEKLQIARKHLLKKQFSHHGIPEKSIRISDPVLSQIVEEYTKESGVRELDRQIAALMRHFALRIAENGQIISELKAEDLPKVLGPRRFDKSIYQEENMPGVAVGLAYTSVGGDILFIESSMAKGNGVLTLTGSLGDVMKESATTAMTFIKSHAAEWGIPPELFQHINIHIHVPEGAVPKDGPSAGITILSSLVSLLTQRKLRPYLAMTGEITLRGKVMPVGGIKEKILAAKRAGIKEIIIGEKNRLHIEEINPSYIRNMKFHFVQTMDEVLTIALQKNKIKNATDYSSFIPKGKDRPH